jgi:hypothetical protein
MSDVPRTVGVAEDSTHKADRRFPCTRKSFPTPTWVAQTVAKRLKLDEARGLIAEWEAENGAFSPEEIARGDERARRLLGLEAEDGSARKPA